jgi:hypothetical protein
MQMPVPERSAWVRQGAARLCRQLDWAPLHEVPLPNGRRADILALRPDGCFVCVEVKSCALDFLADRKWPDYREFCDQLFFAVDADFPQTLLPAGVGVMVITPFDAAILADAPHHQMAAARRRALQHRFARLAACRLEDLRSPPDNAILSCE